MEELLEPFLRRMRIQKVKKYIPNDAILCDIGCGFNAKFLHEIVPYIKKGIGIDKKVDNLKSDKIELIKTKLEKELPLPSNYVDCITLLAVVEHLDYPNQMLTECYRILKSGGVLILTTPTPSSRPILEFLSYKLNIVSKVEISDHKNYFSNEQLVQLLEGYRFRTAVAKTFQFGLNNFIVAIKE